MPSTSVALPTTDDLDTKQSKPVAISRKVRDAIEHMVWHGLPRAQAAEKAGLSDHGLYKALRSPPVKQHYMAELDVLRTSERARNIHRAVEIREQTSNQMASIQAIKLLEQISDDAQHSGSRVNSLPGLQIVVVTGGNAQQPVIDVTERTVIEDGS